MAVQSAHIPPPEANGAPLDKVGTQFAARGHSGGNRVFDYGPGADSATVAADFGFADLLDVINPLQHVPLLGSVYREITGDEISAPARVLGHLLYGGPVGLAFGAANMLFAEVAGRSPGDALVAALFGSGGDAPDPAPALAAADAESPAPQGEAPAAPSSGEAARQALAADIRGRAAAPPQAAQSQAAPPEISESPGRAFKIRARDRRPVALPTPPPQPEAPPRQAALSDLASAAALDPSFAQRMMLALDRYETLTRTRRADETPAGALLDRGL